MTINPNCPLPDIRSIRIDPTLPSDQRVRLFTENIHNPKHFRVDNIEVEVIYSDNAPSLQTCLTNMCRQVQ